MELSKFYGASQHRRLSDVTRAKRLRLAELQVQTPFLAIEGKRLVPEEYSEDVKIFSQQKNAIDNWDEHSDFKIFAQETNLTGQRTFLICHPRKLWSLMLCKKSYKRHFYEVIVSGRPCKLYFDLEFSKKENPDIDEIQLLKRFTTLILTKVKKNFALELSPKEYLDLDSSTEEKFSHHFIFDIWFANNASVGSFVSEFCSELSPEDRERFSFKKQDEKLSLFIDQGVYSKNRNFRMFMCSKYGKKAVLQLGPLSVQDHDKLSKQEIFLRSLVTYNWAGKEISVVKFQNERHQRKPLHEKSCQAVSTKKKSLSSNHSSIFPEIDQFIMNIISPGSIRKIIWKWQESIIEYEINGYRYCENIQRHHRSNNIKLVVMLNTGVYFQVCHDPDCSDFKSQDRPIPLEYQPWTNLFDTAGDSSENETFEDDLIPMEACKEIDEFESSIVQDLEDDELLVKACQMVENQDNVDES